MSDENYLIDTDGDTSALLAPQKSELAYINPTDLPDLDSAEVGFSLEATYLKFSTEGQTVRAFFNGFTTIRKNEGGVIKPMTAAVLQNKNGLYLNSTSNILDQLARIPAGTAIQIKYIGDEKTTNGYNVKKFEINILNVKAAPVVSGTSNTEKPIQSFPQKESDTSKVDLFWKKVYEMELTNIDGQQILKEYNGDFEKAYAALISPF